MANKLRKEELTLNDKIKFDNKGGAILGVLEGPVADPVNPTRNGRHYSDELWDKVLRDPLVLEQFKNGGIVGELDHPEDRDAICTEKVAVIMPEPPVKKDGKYVGKFNILDTPCGRIVHTLAKAGFKLGISSRGNGETFENYNGGEEVDPDSFDFTCFDVVLLPAIESARMKLVTEGLQKKPKRISYEKLLKESFDRSSEKDRKIMKETLDNLNIPFKEEQTKEKSNKERKCCICGKPIKGYGNNAEPIANGTCCDKCNQEVVIPARIKALNEAKEKEEPTLPTEEDETEEERVNLDNIPTDELGDEENSTEEKENEAKLTDDKILELLHTFLKKEDLDLDGEGTEEEDFIELFHEIIPTECIDQPAEDDLTDINDEPTEDDKGLEPPAVDDVKVDEDEELIENFQKSVKENVLLNRKLKGLQAEKAVSNAKVEVLAEELEKFKSVAANAGKKVLQLRNLEAEKRELATKVKTLSEKLDKSISNMKALKESRAKEAKANKVRLDESLKTMKKTSSKQLVEALKKVDSAKSLIEKYKKLAHDVANSYIESKAVSLGVTSNEIKNRLNESYTLKDVDRVCENLQEYSLNISKLPFALDKPGNARVRIREDKSRDPLKNVHQNKRMNDQIDDYTFDLAERFTGRK